MRAKRLLELDSQFQRTTRTAIFSREFRILLHVSENPGCSIKNAQAESGLSHRGFYLKVREMVDNGIIVLSDGEHDRRKRSLNVGQQGTVFLKGLQDFVRADRARAGRGEIAEPLLRSVAE